MSGANWALMASSPSRITIKINALVDRACIDALYLASRAGDYVVGVTIAVDGGVAFAGLTGV